MRTVPDAALLPLMPPLMRAHFDPAFRSRLTREDLGLIRRRERNEPNLTIDRIRAREACRARGIAAP
jgi:hypothetical protein